MKRKLRSLTKAIKRALFALLCKLPAFIKYPAMRSLIHLESELSDDFTFKIADTKEDLEAAFKILHDAYVEMNFMKPSASGMRVTLYHALPHTTTIIAKYKEQIIGTVSIIRENPLGLPLDSDFDTSIVSIDAKKRAEVSALAIDKNYRGQSGAVLFAMFKYVYEYCVNYLNVEAIQMAASPARMDFYLAIIMFKKIENRVIEDQFVNGAEMMAYYVNVPKWHEYAKDTYKNKSLNKNIYNFLVNHKMTNLKFPDRSYFTVTDPVMTPEMLDYFFSQVTDKFHNLSVLEKAALLNVYEGEAYKKILPMLSEEEVKKMKIRNYSRFPVSCTGRLYLDDGQNKKQAYSSQKSFLKIVDPTQKHIDIDVEEVSAFGLMSNRIDIKLQKNSKFKMDVQHGKFSFSEIEVELMWLNENNCGFKLVKASASWHEFISHLESLMNIAPEESKYLKFKALKKVD